MTTATTTGHYFTVLIPAAPVGVATQWHVSPYEPSPGWAGATLSRGAFQTEDLAHAWARNNLYGAPYSVKRIDL